MEVSKEERAFLDALRESPEMVRELAHSLPEAKPEVIRLLHFLLYHFEVENPGPDFLSRFEGVISPTPDDEDEAAADPQKSAKRKKTSSRAGKKSAEKTRKKTRSKTR